MLLLLLPGVTYISFTFEENSNIELNSKRLVTIQELSTLLHNIEMLHECISLSAISDYENYRFTRFFWYRNSRKLKEEHQLYLNKINHNSPLGLEVIIPLTAGVLGIPWLLLQAVEKIQNWKLNREKLQLEVKKLRGEQLQRDAQLDRILMEKNAWETFNRILQKIEASPFVGTNVTIRQQFGDNINDGS